ncbi:hypothetical protein ACFLS0_06485 [Candidatus Bipolaricaulota bacterium]
MFDMQMWQLVVIAVVVATSIGWMSFAVIRLFSRRASCAAIVRNSTAVESALVGGTVPEGSSVFDGWSYRVGARFAGRVRVAVYDDRVAVCGPRVPRSLYEIWIWGQALILALVFPAGVIAVLTLDWRWIIVALVFFIVSWMISMVGAGLWPGLGEAAAVETGHFKAIEFPRSSVHEVGIGKGWSKGGLEIVLFPYKVAIDKMAAGRAVSFFAPDEHGREVCFAVHMYSERDASELADLLDGGRA